MPEAAFRATIEAYLAAFEQRDLSRCVEFYADDARIDFGTGVFQGKQAIEQWHSDRFDADAQVTRIEKIRTQGNEVIVDAVGTSRLARAWKFNALAGRATFVFEQGKIKEAKVGLRMAIPIERW
jgi:ketosteroid isomerase-like protein